MPEPGAHSVSEQVAANVRALREHRGMSQAALARAMKERNHPWHQATVHRIESGQQVANVDEAAALAAILGVPLDRLTWATGERAEQMLAEGAITRLREAAEAAVVAVARLYAAQAAAERAGHDAEKSQYTRVRETAQHIEGELADVTVEHVLAEAELRWDATRKGR